MSVQAISWVIDNSKHSLGDLIVLLMIANHAKSDGTGAWPSLALLAKESRMSERNVRYCLRNLERSGELVTHHGKGPKGTNLYDVNITGAKFAGGKMQREGGKIRHRGGQPIAPEPSLTVIIKPSVCCLTCKNHVNGKTFQRCTEQGICTWRRDRKSA